MVTSVTGTTANPYSPLPLSHWVSLQAKRSFFPLESRICAVLKFRTFLATPYSNGFGLVRKALPPCFLISFSFLLSCFLSFFFFLLKLRLREAKDFPGLLSTLANEAVPCTHLFCSWFCKLRTFSHRIKSIASRSSSPLCLGMRCCSDVTTGTRAIPFGIMDLVHGEDAKATISPPAPLTYICWLS